MARGNSALDLYRAHRGGLVTYANRILRDPARAEDIVQDAWLIFDQLPSKASVQDPAAYLRRMVRNLALNAVRHVARRQRWMDGELASASETIADAGPLAEQQLIAREELDRFLTRLAALPERQQKAIRMHRMEGYKMREIAAELGVSIALVHSLIADGLVKCADPPEGTGDEGAA